MKKTVSALAAVFVIAAALLLLPGPLSKAPAGIEIEQKEIVEVPMYTAIDMSIPLSLSDMKKDADLILLGSFTGKTLDEEKQLDPRRPDIDTDRSFEFMIDKVVFGDYPQKNIEVVQSHEYTWTFRDYAGGKNYPVLVPDPLYSDPDMTAKHLIFLKHVNGSDAHYRPCGEPWDIAIDGSGLLRSDSIVFASNEPADRDAYLETDKKIYHFIFTTTKGVYEDFITGRTLEDALAELKD